MAFGGIFFVACVQATSAGIEKNINYRFLDPKAA